MGGTLAEHGLGGVFPERTGPAGAGLVAEVVEGLGRG